MNRTLPLPQRMFTTVLTHTWPAAMDLVDLLFFISAAVVALEIKLVGSFTIYDLVVGLVAALIMVGPRRLHLLPTNVTVAILFFLAAAFLSTARATYPYESFTQILQYVFVFFIQLPVILTLVRSRFTLNASMALFCCSVMVGIVWSFVYQQKQGAGRVLTFYSDNPNRLGYPTAYLLPIVLHFIADAWRRRAFWVIAIAAPVVYLLIWALAASGSRSATVGTLVGLMIFIVFRQGFEINFKIIFRVVGAALLIGGIGFVLYKAEYMPATLRTRIERTLNFEESLVDDRRRLATAGWNAFEESPFIGVGLDNFRYVAKRYLQAATNQTPHNLWIQYLAQVGLIGTVAFALILAYWYVTILQTEHRIRDPSVRQMLWALIAAMTAVITIHMFLPSLDQRQYWFLYGVGLAIMLQTFEQAQEPQSTNNQQLALPLFHSQSSHLSRS